MRKLLVVHICLGLKTFEPLSFFIFSLSKIMVMSQREQRSFKLPHATV